MKRGIIWIFIGLAVGAVGRTEYSVQPVADIPIDGQVWDMSHLEPVGQEVGYRVDAGASAHVWSSVKRLDFVTTQGDTVLQTCAETRSYRAVFSPGILRESPDGAGGSEPFCLKGRIHQSSFVTGTGTATVAPLINGTLITASGDTIHGASLHHDMVTMRWSVATDSVTHSSMLPDSIMRTTVIDNYRIMVPQMPFPYAMKRVDTTLSRDRIVSRDSIAWMFSESPADKVERMRRKPMRDDARHDRMPLADGIDDIDGGHISISIDGEDITVSSPCTVPARIVITDMLGRIYHDESTVLGPASGTLPAIPLPRGEYLIQVIPASGPTAALKFAR